MKYLIILVIVFGIGAGAIALAVRAAQASPPPAATAKPLAEVRKYPVRVQPIKTRGVVYEVPAVGNLEPQDVYRIDSQVAGTIYDVSFKEGDDVSAKQVLCRIAPEAYRLIAARDEAMLKGAVADLADAKRRLANDIDRKRISLKEAQTEIDRRIAVKTAGAISEEDIQLYQAKRDLADVELRDATQASETQLRSLEAVIQQRESQWKISSDDVRKSTVLPPIAGKIDKKYITNGMYVPSGTPLASIIDRRTLKLRFKLSERDSAVVKVGDKVRFNVPAWPSREFEATVYQVSDQTDSDARVVSCLAKIEKDLDKLIPGYFASVHLQSGSSSQAVVVPTTAILTTEKGFAAFVIKPGDDPVAEKRKVTIGLSVTDNNLEVLSGLASNETLVIEGASSLDDGYHVTILPDGNVVPNGDAPEVK
jgi:multidrug efflux pump subunit AcrA (membrane-fusion protein)